MTFSHELIHNIGGEEDTNRNLTRRLLLLLESVVVGGESQAYDRVIRSVLRRYIPEVTERESGAGISIPRFLLNDIARLWRTMAVDFATKQWERPGEKWGLRAVKLRFSRKLIFASGLLTCYRSGSKPIEEFVRMTPLNILADSVSAYGVHSEISKELFDCYDEFVGVVSNSKLREELEKIRPDGEAASELFQRMRTLGHRFQDALDTVFFGHREIGDLTRKYGVF
ncbi:MAG TPA: hypothetical protein VJB15_00505 [Rhodothermia bacterium]|nr:hypothetical protein [Rhodothermia bacterium]